MSQIDDFLNDSTAPAPAGATPAKAPEKKKGSEIDSFLSDAPSQARGIGGLARDVAAWGVKGAIAVPEAAVGLADIATGGRAGKFLENADGAVGFRPKQAREAVNDWHSEATKDAQRKFQEAEGIGGKFQAAIQNPSNIVGAVAESLPSMAGGAVAARGLLGATRLGQAGAKATAAAEAAGLSAQASRAAGAAASQRAAAIAGAAGEGIMMAGSQAEAIRQETPDGLLTPAQAGIAAATGGIGGLIGGMSGRLANRLGVGDADTMLAQGAKGLARQNADEAAAAAANPLVQQSAKKSAKSVPRQVIEGAITEGLLEELPQSVAEQLLQNLALDKPWSEGLDDAIVLGALSGGAMGAGAAGYRGLTRPTATGELGAAPAEPGAAPAPAGQPLLGLPAPAAQGAQEQPPIQVSADGVARTQPYQTPGYVGAGQGDVTDVVPREPQAVPVKPSEAMGLNPNAGALSASAVQAVDSGASDTLQAAAAQAQTAEQAAKAPAPTKAQAEEIDLADIADPYERAYYESFFADAEDAQIGPEVHTWLQDDTNIPDLDAASSASDEDFLRALGANDQEITDAIASIASQPSRPQEDAQSLAGAQANEPADTRQGAGEAARTQGGQVDAGARGEAVSDLSGVDGPGLDDAGRSAADTGVRAAETGWQPGAIARAPDAGNAQAAAVGGSGAVNDALTKTQPNTTPAIAQQAPAAINTGAQDNGTQANQAQQAKAQPAQEPGPAGNAPAAPAAPTSPKQAKASDQALSDGAAPKNLKEGLAAIRAKRAEEQAAQAGVNPHAEPGISQTEPGISQTEPGISQTEPGISQTEPGPQVVDGAASPYYAPVGDIRAVVAKQIPDMDAAPTPKPAPVKPSVKARIEAAHQTRADHFAPGNIVKSYSGHDRVVSYSPPPKEGGNWSVTVQAVVKQGDAWVDAPNESQRTHSTQPGERELKVGPVEKAQAKAADAKAPASLVQAAKDNGKLEIVTVGDKKPAPEQKGIALAGWTPETGDQGNTIWTKTANSELYTATLDPAASTMEVTVLVGVVDSQIASFKVESSEQAARMASEAVARDVAETKAEKKKPAPAQEAAGRHEHAGLKIYPIKVKVGGEVVAKWAVQTLVNAEREKNGERQLGGDPIADTLDGAKALAEGEIEAWKRLEEYRADMAALDEKKKESDAIAQSKKDASKGRSIVERARDARLDSTTNIHPSFGLGTGSKRESMQMAVAQDRLIEVAMVRDEAAKKRDKALIVSGRNLPTGNVNYPGVKEYFEAAGRLKANDYKKPEYRVFNGRDSSGSFYRISKTEYDYAQGLIAGGLAMAKLQANPAAADDLDAMFDDVLAEEVAKRAPDGSVSYGIARTELAPEFMTAEEAVKQSRGPAASEAWKNEGKSPAELVEERAEALGNDLMAQIAEEAAQQDFAPSDLPAAVRMWAEENNVPADSLRRGVLMAIGQYGLSDGRIKQIKTALNLARNAAEAGTQTPAKTAQPAAERPAASAKDGTVSLPKAVSEAIEDDMRKQKARVSRMKTQAAANGLDLEGRKAALLKVAAAEATMRKMRLSIFDAEDAAVAAIKAGNTAPFAEHADLFPQAQQALVDAQATATPAAAKKPLTKDQASLNAEIDERVEEAIKDQEALRILVDRANAKIKENAAARAAAMEQSQQEVAGQDAKGTYEREPIVAAPGTRIVKTESRLEIDPDGGKIAMRERPTQVAPTKIAPAKAQADPAKAPIQTDEALTPEGGAATESEGQGAEDVRFSRSTKPGPTFSPAARMQAVQAVEKTANAIRNAWANGPQVVVAFDMQDPVVPESARRADLKQRSGGARGAPEGFYYRGKVYLIASKLNTVNDAARVLFHEALGHHGLRGAFGKEMDGVLNQVATMRRAQVDAKIKEYGLRGVNALDRRAAAEEVLAEMAQTTPEIGFVKRAVAAIRNWLRANVPGFKSLDMTDADIIEAFILPARRFVERGSRGPGGGVRIEPTMGAFSRATDQTQTEALKKKIKETKEEIDVLRSAEQARALAAEREGVGRAKSAWEAEREVAIKDRVNADVLGVALGMARRQGGEAAAFMGQAREKLAGSLDANTQRYAQQFEEKNPRPEQTSKSPEQEAESDASKKERAIRQEAADKIWQLQAEVEEAYQKLQILSAEARAENERAKGAENGDSTELFHGSFEKGLRNDGTGRFGGIFSLPSAGRAGAYGSGFIYKMSVANEKIMGKGAPDGFSEKEIWAALRPHLGKGFKEKHKALIWEMVVEDIDPTESRSSINFHSDYQKTLSKLQDLYLALPWEEAKIDIEDYSWAAQKLRGQLAKSLGFDAVSMSDENGTSYLVVSDLPMQAVDPDIRFSRAKVADLKASALDQIHNTLSHPGKVSLWDKTVGTMRNLAERNPAFKPVFNAAQQHIDDVSTMANDAADAAPRILPKLETWRDLGKKPVSTVDNAALGKALFGGTLEWARGAGGKPVRVTDLQAQHAGKTAEQKVSLMQAAGHMDAGLLRMWRGLPIDQFEKLIESRFESKMLKAGVVWSDKELASVMGLNPQQISLYREARAAVDRSIDMTSRADMLRLLGQPYAAMRGAVLDAPTLQDAMDLLTSTLVEDAKADPDASERLMQQHNQVVDRATQARDLMDAGYMPLSRFGQYTLDVVDAAGERQYFSLFESVREANQMALKMRSAFPGANVVQGTMSQQAFKLFQGVTPESLEIFGNMLGLDSEGNEAKDKAFQEYLKLTKNNHSALKRMIHRQGIAGYSEDVGRVLAGFVYSNARQAAGALNAGTMEQALMDIPKEQGELKDVALGLRSYISDPQEEGQAVRGMLFAQYLGGSVASAFVNMTQPFAVTLPWLSQFGGITKAGKYMASALNDMRKRGFKYEADLAKALQAAEDDGTVSPQEVHQLMAQSRGAGALRSGDGTRTGDARAAVANNWERLKVGWGQPFALAEQFNRRSTFIAAYRMAKANGEADPAAFASKAVLETQFLYCVDESTECLTTAGWKSRSSLVVGDVVLGVDAQGRAVETPLLAVHQFSGVQQVAEFSNGNRFSMVVTSGHRHLVQNYDSRKKEWSKPLVRTTDELRGGHQLMRVPSAAVDRPAGDADFAALLGWVASEGTYAKFRNCKQKRNVRLVQSSSHNPEYVAEIESLLKRLGGHYRRFETPNQLTLFTLKKPLSTRVLEAMPDKLLTWSMASSMGADEMKALLDAFSKGDGHHLREGGWSIGQKQEQNLHVLQAMAVLCGQNATLYPATDRENGKVAHLYLHAQGKRTMVKQLTKTATQVTNGVWCPETGTGTWIARRNGAVFVTGNSKANKMRWGRGAVGGTLMTFKTYSISYLELMHRTWNAGAPGSPERAAGRRAVGWGMAMLMLMGGAGGLPFMEDLEDLIDALAQLMGYNVSAKQWRQQAMEDVVGKELADFLGRGISGLPGSPVDVSGRLGMGDLLPGTGLFQTKQSHVRDMLELAGPAGDLVGRAFSGGARVLKGDLAGAALEFSPSAVRNAAKGYDMAATGIYKDTKGYKVLDTTLAEAASKFVGFQPKSVADVQEANSFMMRSKAFYTQTSSEIRAQWAKAIFDKDDAAVQRARERLADWNENNPDQRITIRMPDVWKRVREMGKDRAERIADTAPKALRQKLREDAQALRG